MGPCHFGMLRHIFVSLVQVGERRVHGLTGENSIDLQFPIDVGLLLLDIGRPVYLRGGHDCRR